MGAVVALGSGVRIGVDVEGIVGAGLHTRFTTDAAVFVKIHDAIRAKIKCFDRTNLNTWSIGAVVAAHHREQAAGMRELAFFNLFDPSTEHTDWYVVFGFTGGGAGMAADTLAVVYYKAVFHANGWLLRSVILWP